MRIHVAAIGRLKREAERDLLAKYIERFEAVGRGISLGPLKLTELPESRSATADLRKADEAARLLKATGSEPRIALDEHGRAISSAAFADWLRKERDGGAQSLALLIGGPDGHGAAALEGAALHLSLGPMTLPHGLARIVLIEQLYRAATILSGHPYHRS